MKFRAVTLLLLAVTAGCSSVKLPSKPFSHPDPTNTRAVIGTVYYTSGRPVANPRVEASTGAVAFGDSQGNYRLLLPIEATNVCLSASNGQYFIGGTAIVPDTSAQVRVDIVVSYSEPI